MIRRADQHLDVVSLAGTLLCRLCGEAPATLYGRFCSPTCRAGFRHLDDPDPTEIRDRCAAIQATWSEDQEISRRDPAYRVCLFAAADPGLHRKGVRTMTSGQPWTRAEQLRALKLLRDGATRQVIADHLGIRRQTVQTMIDSAAVGYLESLSDVRQSRCNQAWTYLR